MTPPTKADYRIKEVHLREEARGGVKWQLDADQAETFEQAGKTILKKVVELKKSGERWAMVQPPYGEAELGNLIQQVTDLSVHYKDSKDSDFVADAVTDLVAYNLDPSQPTLRIEGGRGEEGKGLTKQAVVVGTGKKVHDAAKKAEDRYFAYVESDSQAKDVVREYLYRQVE